MKLRGLKTLYYLTFKKASSLSNEKLEAQLRARIHAVEKQGNVEDTTDFHSMVWGRKLYHEAKKRNILSTEEIEWCKAILFGKSIEIRSPVTIEQDVNKVVNLLKDRRSIRQWQDAKLEENLKLLDKWPFK